MSNVVTLEDKRRKYHEISKGNNTEKQGEIDNVQKNSRLLFKKYCKKICKQ